eukprot:scaffold30792_cov63-Phaeocystis_antarctica.AAC.6
MPGGRCHAMAWCRSADGASHRGRRHALAPCWCRVPFYKWLLQCAHRHGSHDYTWPTQIPLHHSLTRQGGTPSLPPRSSLAPHARRHRHRQHPGGRLDAHRQLLSHTTTPRAAILQLRRFVGANYERDELQGPRPACTRLAHKAPPKVQAAVLPVRAHEDVRPAVVGEPRIRRVGGRRRERHQAALVDAADEGDAKRQLEV